MTPDQFVLGTHEAHWIGRPEFVSIPLCVSQNRLVGRKSYPRGTTRVVLDSGGFTALKTTGTWPVTAREFAARTRRMVDEIGTVDWVAPQDWMCEDAIINGGVVNGQRFVGTHLSVAEHQRRTVQNFIELRELDPDLPVRPVLQGQTADDYLRCADLYAARGVDLLREPLVGLGSVCRRQDSAEIGAVVTEVAALGLRLHGFGVKLLGLRRYGPWLAAADSMAWSYAARRRPPLAECAHEKCNNCSRFAIDWYQRVRASLAARSK